MIMLQYLKIQYYSRLSHDGSDNSSQLALIPTTEKPVLLGCIPTRLTACQEKGTNPYTKADTLYNT